MEATTEMIKFEEVSSTLMLAEPVLIKNRNLFQQADSKAKSLLDTIEAEGMSDEIDEEVNKWQVNAKKALQINYDRRTPITQILTKISSEFTSLENPLNPQKADSIFNKLQAHRNTWATAKEKERKAKEAKILLNQNIEKERISLRVEAEKTIREAYNKKLYAFKAYISKLVNEATLDIFKEVTIKLNDVKIEYPRDAFEKLECPLFSTYLSSEEVRTIAEETNRKLYLELSANFRENMEVDKQQAIDQLPSKKNELERIAKASAKEAEQLRMEAEKRKQLEADKLKIEQEDQAKKDTAKLESEKSMGEAQNLFNAHFEMAEVATAAKKVKKSYVIEVSNVAGLGAIFMFYFEKVGITLDVETFSKKSLNQMKKEVEKIANTTSEMIEHPSIKYVEDIKAVIAK